MHCVGCRERVWMKYFVLTYPIACVMTMWTDGCVRTESRNVLAVVNSSTELNCSLSTCTSNIVWSYVTTLSSPQLNSHGLSSLLMTPPCISSGRCQVSSRYDGQMRRSLLSIEQVQFTDASTYLCSCGTMQQPDYSEMSFNFTGSFQLCLLLLAHCLLQFVCLYVLL